jgi:hypothetical protein
LNGTNKILTPPTLAGLLFCLASAEDAGLLFCPAAMQPYTSVYSAFCATHAVIPPTPQNAHRALQMLFLRLCPLNHPRYQTDTNGYNTTYDTLEHVTAAQRLQHVPDTSATPDAIQASTATIL